VNWALNTKEYVNQILSASQRRQYVIQWRMGIFNEVFLDVLKTFDRELLSGPMQPFRQEGSEVSYA
jgi:hypothetical protein